VERGEPDGPLTRASEAVRRPGDGGEGGGGAVGTSVWSTLGLGEWEMGVRMSAVRRDELLTLL
jgi:hypothetical protein